MNTNNSNYNNTIKEMLLEPQVWVIVLSDLTIFRFLLLPSDKKLSYALVI